MRPPRFYGNWIAGKIRRDVVRAISKANIPFEISLTIFDNTTNRYFYSETFTIEAEPLNDEEYEHIFNGLIRDMVRENEDFRKVVDHYSDWWVDLCIDD